MSDADDNLREAIKVVRKYADDPGSIWPGSSDPYEVLRVLIAAAESTLPKTKTVEVWHVEWALGSHPMIHLYLSEADARKNATLLAQEQHRTCIRVTGPHQQEVPK